MRKYNKFALVNNFYIYPYFFNKRVLKFKRPKWLKVQEKILNLEKEISTLNILPQVKSAKIKIKPVNFLLQSNILKNLFFDFIFIKSKIKSWQRLRFFYKEALLMKNAARKYFDGQFSLSFFKKLFKKAKTRCFIISSIFIRPEFRLDILLWRLKIFSSVFLVKKAIQNKQILINNLHKNFDFFLAQGDCIKVLPLRRANLKVYFLKYFKMVCVPWFAEVEPYTNSIAILKSFYDFKLDHFFIIIREPLCVQKLKNYITK
jgi:hypothetical protein